MSKPNKQETSRQWEDFWESSPTGFDQVMLQSTAYFARKLEAAYPGNNTERLLDLGCGPGFLIRLLKDHYAYIHGTDISAPYIELCKNAFSGNDHIEFSQTAAYDYDAYCSLICKLQITRVVMLSVLQYYRSLEEVRQLLLALKTASKTQPFTCILADIMPRNHSVLSDITSISWQALKKGYSWQFARFVFYALFSDYSKVKKTGLLQIDQQFFSDMASELEIAVTFVKGLSIHSGRYSVVLDFTT